MKHWKNHLAALLALALILSLAACGGNPAPAESNDAPDTSPADEPAAPQLPEGALVIAEQGMFSSGGTVTEPVEGEYDETTNWLELERRGNTAHVGHANVLCQIPAKETGLPIVYLHGYGQSRMGWMTTPDGRDGWSTLFLQKGHSAFLVDQPGRGEAGSAVEMTMDGMLDAWAKDSKAYKPGDQAWYTHFRIGRVAPERYEGSQFPEGNAAQDQFFRQMTPNTTTFDQPGSEQYQRLLEAKIPVAVYFGDYIDNGPEDIMSTGFWKSVRDGALAFAEQYNADGGVAAVFDLPKEGITGNSHFMFQELNNDVIADHIESWIQTNVR